MWFNSLLNQRASRWTKGPPACLSSGYAEVIVDFFLLIDALMIVSRLSFPDENTSRIVHQGLRRLVPVHTFRLEFAVDSKIDFPFI